MNFDHGPLDLYEVIWKSGHVERVHGHQVLWPPLYDLSLERGPPREHVMIHGEIRGRWKLVLSAPADEIHTIRLITTHEPIPGEATDG